MKVSKEELEFFNKKGWLLIHDWILGGFMGKRVGTNLEKAFLIIKKIIQCNTQKVYRLIPIRTNKPFSKKEIKLKPGISSFSSWTPSIKIAEQFEDQGNDIYGGYRCSLIVSYVPSENEVIFSTDCFLKNVRLLKERLPRTLDRYEKAWLKKNPKYYRGIDSYIENIEQNLKSMKEREVILKITKPLVLPVVKVVSCNKMRDGLSELKKTIREAFIL